MLSMLVLISAGCSKEATPDEEEEVKLEQTVSLDKTTLSMQLGDEAALSAVFEAGVVPRRSYNWQSSNADIVSVAGENNHRAKLTAKKEGTATITYRSQDGELSATCDVQVSVESDGVIRILAIGNSFSDDALEHYLYGLAKASDIPVVIGNMYIGGASFSRHVEEITKADGVSDYSYRKIDVNGAKTTRANTSLAVALADERWDYVSFQQASPNSGQYSTFVAPFPVLYNYVKNQLDNRPSVKYVFHQTWAYEQTSTHAGFAAYGNDQLTMYNAIIDAVNKATDLVDIDVVVPAGTAIQNGRTSVVGDNFCRDGYHLDLSIGRYTASCAWFEAIFGQSVLDNTFKPAALSDFETEIAQHAAHFAVQKPNGITELTDYQSWPNNGLPMGDVFIDFNRASATAGWNGFTNDALVGYRLANLQDKEGNFTGIGVETLERFGGQNGVGPTATTTPFEIPGTVSSTSFFGNSKAVFQGLLIEKSVLKFDGLDKDKRYNFCFFSSRMSVTGNRETAFTLKGESEQTVFLDAVNNTSEIICAENVQPDANGELTLTITAGPNNTDATGFYHVNALRITSAGN